MRRSTTLFVIRHGDFSDGRDQQVIVVIIRKLLLLDRAGDPLLF